ncbi:putative disease resistance protein At1g52660 [Silene latifolia]|uniref:putative disease resistance protein At1g52660 n=1 Tax=Silene latifolia TaxID=37657 RepID=UPI003D7783A0
MGNIFQTQFSCGDAVITRCLDCIGGKWEYVSDLEHNLKRLETLAHELRSLENDMITCINIEERQGKKCLDQVQLWLSRVDLKIDRIKGLLENRQQETAKLCIACCSTNYVSSYKFGKKVVRRLKEVNDLIQQGKEFKVVATIALPEALVEIPCEPTVGLELKLDSIYSYLLDEEVGIVGLFGESGVGKTALLMQINNKICNEISFDLVIWVSVSKQLKLENIQNHIGKKIGFSGDVWMSKSLSEKAVDILNVLKTKKFVLLLDDIFESINLTEIGVPLRNSNMSKVVFTTNLEKICTQMRAQKIIKVEPLGLKDSWRLFSDITGEDTLNSNPKIYHLAKELVAECRGVPSVLIKMAHDMAGKMTALDWTNAVKSLRGPMSNSQEEIIENQISMEDEEEECTTTLRTKLGDTDLVFGSPITEKTVRRLPQYVSRTRITVRDLAVAAFDRETEGGKDVEAREYVNWLKTKHGNGVVTICLFYNATGSTLHFSGQKDWNGHLSEELHPKTVENGQWGVFVHVHDNFNVGRGGSRGAIVYTGKNAYDNDCDWMLAWDNTSNDNQVHDKVFTEVRWKDHFFIQMPYIFHLLSGSGAHREDTHGGCVSSITLENTSGPFFIAKLSLDLAY